jgi:signal transduction histidine kinase
MRAGYIVLAAVGGCALAVAVAIELAIGDPAGAGWVLVGPGPFYAAGLVGAFRRPGHRAAAWLLACGAMFLLDVCLGDAVLPVAAGSSFAWIAALAGACAGNACVVAAIGLIGLFPTGVPQRRSERWVLRTAAVMAVLLPVLLMISSSTAPQGSFGGTAGPAIASPLFLPAARPLAPIAAWLYNAFAAWVVLGVIMLYLRYQRSPSEDRRRIRFLLVGAAGAMVVFAALIALAWSLGPGFLQVAAISILWALTVVFALGSLVVALSHDGVMGIDQSSRRSMVYRALWLLIAAGYVAAAAALGVVASRYLPIGAAVLLATGAALLFQPAQRRLEQLADRWVFGARLDGYDVLARFGSMLEASPGPGDLLPRLADAIRRGLCLQWARVRLDLAAAGNSLPTVGASGVEPDEVAEPALVVPLIHAGTTLGRIECGHRRDGPLLYEDRRLLADLAGQAATAARNLHLTAELSDRLEVIRRQTAELTASRARLVRAQDEERQRIERNLHDGAQQQLVALTVQLSLLEDSAEDPGEVRRMTGQLRSGLRAALDDLRALARGIYPPLLADQGLGPALRAQADRAPLPVMIQADGIGRYPRDAEAAVYFCTLEALQNVAKYARASRATVALSCPDGHLEFSITDDGAGFDTTKATRGTGLQGMADRLAVAGGTLLIHSKPGLGTTVSGRLPVPELAETRR